MANSKIRRDLFQIYSNNLSLYRPDLTDKFLCPICLEQFSDPSQVALAHVVPDAIEGKLKTLSCNRCDSIIGHNYDRHLVKEKEHFDDFKKPSQAYVLFQPKKNKGIKAVADLDGLRGNNPHIDFYNTSKMLIDAYRDYFANGPGTSMEFSLKFERELIDFKKRNLALIHSAFLMMFYQLGYEYILSKNADYIRKAINDQSQSIDFRNAIDYVRWGPMSEPFSVPTIAFTRISTNLYFLSALIPFEKESGYIVQLPGFEAEGLIAYESLLHMGYGTYNIDTKIIPNNILSKNLNGSCTRNFGYQMWKNIVESAFR